MTIVFGIIFLLIFKDSKVRVSSQQNGYLSQKTANQVRGLFSVLIFLSHYVQYLKVGKYDALYMSIQAHLDQAVVIPFLFYSGYGMTISVLNKGKKYIETVIRYRIPRVFLSTTIAVTLFLILKILKKEEISGHQIFMSYIFWDSLGNSNWYIFGILGEYLIFAIAFLLYKVHESKKNLFAGLVLTTILTCVFVIWIKSQGKQTWWYNTLIVFSVGCWYAVFSDKIGKIVQQSWATYLKTAIMLGALYYFAILRRSQGLIWYSIWDIAFMGLMLLITMKIEFRSFILRFFGGHIFSIYVLQRIPMIVLTWIGLMSGQPYLSFVIALICTCLIAVVFDKGTDTLFRKIRLLPQ